MKKRMWIVLVAVMSLFILSACKGKSSKDTSSKDWGKIKASGELIIGVDDTFVPMGFRDENDELVGFDIDLAKALCKELGVKAKFQAIDWSMKETELKNGTIDIIWNGYTMNEERAKKVSFSNPYLKNEQVVVTLKKYNIKKYSDLKGKVLGAQEGSSGVDALESKPEVLLDIIKNGEPVLYATFTEAFLDLNAGRIQGLIIDSVFAEYFISQEDNKEDYLIMPSEFAEEDYAIGIRKDDKETLKKINEALAKIYSDGEAEKVSEKWFGENKLIPQNE